MNLDDWKVRVQSDVAAMGRFLRGFAPGTLYGFMATSTLMPLANAATLTQTTQLLASIVGSDGADRIAGELRGWRDRSEAEVARELRLHVVDDDDLRNAIDVVMHEVGTLQALQDTLSEADQAWFRESLRTEMAQLGNANHYAAMVTGSGAIALGGGVAAGEGGVAVGGDVHGDVNVHNYPAPPNPEEIRANEAEEKYLRALLRQCNILPFGALGGSEGVDEEITLDDVYIALNVQDQGRLEPSDAKRIAEREAVPALAIMAQSQRLALLGAAGAGKSTFAKQVLARVAKARLGEGQPLDGWPHDLLPLLVNVRDLGPYLETLALNGLTADKRRQAMVSAIHTCLHDQMVGEGCRDFCHRLDTFLSAGKVFLVLDGLDEVGHETRPLVREAIDALRKRSAAGLRLLVTARTYSYTEEITFPNFARADLLSFSEEQIEAFVAGVVRCAARARQVDQKDRKCTSRRSTDCGQAYGAGRIGRQPNAADHDGDCAYQRCWITARTGQTLQTGRRDSAAPLEPG